MQKCRPQSQTLTPRMNHDDSPSQVSAELHDGVFVRSMYFFDPDGICLEFAAWTRALGPQDVEHAPMNAEGVPDYGVLEGSKLEPAE